MTQPSVSKKMPQSDSLCPCGSGATFGACCEPALKQQVVPATAEALMRSRFTAHFVGDYPHLHRTYLESARQPYVEEPSDGGELAWTRLAIHAHELGPKPDMATVDFSAYYAVGEGEQALHEKSEFRRIDGAWYYVKSLRLGPAPVKSAHLKIGRNDPCSCGSGKKFKHCCGR